MNHVFISYSSQNIEYARRLADKLRDEGFDVWLDNRRLHSSEDWWKSIVLALRECAAVVVILTPESDSSRWVQREITIAEKYEKALFPLLLDGNLDTPNWELFVRTQVENVRGGILPPAEFYEFLANYAPRSQRKGADVTNVPVKTEIDPEMRAEIADPPPVTELTVEKPVADNPKKSPARNRLVVLSGLGALFVVILLIINPQNLTQQNMNTPTHQITEPTSTTQTQSNIIPDSPTPTVPTNTLSPTPSITSTFTPTLSETEHEQNEQAIWTNTPTVTLTHIPTVLPAPTRIEGYIIALSSVNLRSGPGTSYSVTRALPDSSTFTVIAIANGWYLVETSDNNYGWVRGDLVYLRGSSILVPTAVTIPAPPLTAPTSNPSTEGQIAIPAGDLPDLVISSATLTIENCESTQVNAIATNTGRADSKEFSLKLTESMTGIILGEDRVANLRPGESITLSYMVRPTRNSGGILGTVDNKRQVTEASESNNSYTLEIPDSYFEQCF